MNINDHYVFFWRLDTHGATCPLLRFMSRHSDADLVALMTTSVPPADLSKVDMFKIHAAKYQQKAGSISKKFQPMKSVHFQEWYLCPFSMF